MNYKLPWNDRNHKESIARYALYVEDYVCNGYSLKGTAVKYGCSIYTVSMAVSKYFKREEYDMVLRSKLWDEI